MNREMAVPDPQSNQLLPFLGQLLGWSTLYTTMHTLIYYVFKYWTDSRDAKIDDAVDKRFKIQVKPLEDKIQALTDLVVQHFELKK